jgi:hypothetical protein
MAVECAHGSVGLRVVIHSDEREPARFASHAVHHQMDFIDGAVLFEQILKIVLGALKREITYVQFHCVLNLEKLPKLQSRSRESGFKPPMSDAHLTIYRAVKLNRVIQ